MDNGVFQQNWSKELSADVVKGIQYLCDSSREFDGTDPLGEAVIRSLTISGLADHLVCHSDSGEVVGYANILPGKNGNPPMVELVVHPNVRGKGLGGALVGEVLAKAGKGFRRWAHGNLPAAAAVARKFNLVPARELLQLRRKVNDTDISELVLPQGITLRSYAGVADDAELLRVNNAAFAWHPEQGGWTQRQIAERVRQPWFDPQGLLLAFAADQPEQLCGFHWTKLHSHDEGILGEVYIVGVDPSAQGLGLGRVLTLAGLRYLCDRGVSEVLLYVEADNLRAVRTYRGLGFTDFHHDIAYALNPALTG